MLVFTYQVDILEFVPALNRFFGFLRTTYDKGKLVCFFELRNRLSVIEVQSGTYLGEDDIKRINDKYKRD